jgi:hypothetical protein
VYVVCAWNTIPIQERVILKHVCLHDLLLRQSISIKGDNELLEEYAQLQETFKYPCSAR